MLLKKAAGGSDVKSGQAIVVFQYEDGGAGRQQLPGWSEVIAGRKRRRKRLRGLSFAIDYAKGQC